jgi:hypothetical protein
MQGGLHKILSVDSSPHIFDLTSVLLGSRNDIEVMYAKNPKDAKKLILSNSPYSIIISENKFADTSDTGKEFFKVCRNETPVSSRIFCSGPIPRQNFVSLKEKGEIYSSVNKSEGLINDSILSATVMGIEYHKINLFEHYLNTIDLKSIDSIDESLNRLDQIKEKFDWEPRYFDLMFKFEDWETEINQLSFMSDRVTRVYLEIYEKIFKLEKGERTIGNKVEEATLRALKYISRIYKKMFESNLSLIRRTNRIFQGLEQVEKIFKRTAEVDDFLKRIKDGR